MDYPPILDRPVAAGPRVVSFKWPDGARASRRSRSLGAGRPSSPDGRSEGCVLTAFSPPLSWSPPPRPPPRTRPTSSSRRVACSRTGAPTGRKGKLKQALDNFNTIVAGFASTDSIGPALLEIGRYRLEVDGDVEKARASFDQVAKQYPQSDAAPGAYYYLGLLTLNRATTAAELEDALAQLTRVLRLYPKSDWVPKALQAQGLVYRKAGRYAEAVDVARRVFLEYPSSDAAPAAQYLVGQGLALLGEPRQAMEEFQRVRNRFPESEWAARALERTTALYRLYGYGKPTLRPRLRATTSGSATSRRTCARSS